MTVATIPLTRGRVALVDDADLPSLMRWRWSYVPSSSPNRDGYAARWEKDSGRRRTVYMHRQLMGLAGGRYPTIDHRNNDGLDNRRENLRVGSLSHNFANRHTLPKKASPYRGVYPAKRAGRWEARAKVGGCSVHLGTFDTQEQAARAYDAHARITWGDFARTNFPEEG